MGVATATHLTHACHVAGRGRQQPTPTVSQRQAPAQSHQTTCTTESKRWTAAWKAGNRTGPVYRQVSNRPTTPTVLFVRGRLSIRCWRHTHAHTLKNLQPTRAVGSEPHCADTQLQSQAATTKQEGSHSTTPGRGSKAAFQAARQGLCAHAAECRSHAANIRLQQTICGLGQHTKMQTLTVSPLPASFI